jgi:hypothetical protein
VDEFEHPAVLGVGWHHPYYDRLITGAGLVKGADYPTSVGGTATVAPADTARSRITSAESTATYEFHDARSDCTIPAASRPLRRKSR